MEIVTEKGHTHDRKHQVFGVQKFGRIFYECLMLMKKPQTHFKKGAYNIIVLNGEKV